MHKFINQQYLDWKEGWQRSISKQLLLCICDIFFPYNIDHSTKNVCSGIFLLKHTYTCSFCKGWKWEKFRIRKGQTCKRKALTSILAFIMRLTDICLLTYREMHLLDHHWRRLMIVRPSGSHCFLLMGIPSYNLHTAAPPPPPPPSHSPCYAFAMSGRNNYWPKSISSEELQREASFLFTDALKCKSGSITH